MKVARWIASMSAAVAAGSAWAHAFLDHAQPPVGSVVHEAPARVEVWFSEDLEPAFSTLKVLNAADQQVDRMDKSVPGSDRSRMSVSLKALPPGKYRVRWRAVSVDTHVTQGDFTFEIAP
ncbi:MAG TPA: copper resistance CopC family protein [Caldimonas sp.]